MRKLLTKSLSALLVFVMLMSITLYVPVMVSATQIDSTEDNILKIYDLNDLIAINEDLNGNYILMNDIDLSSIDSWTPIGEGIEYWANKEATGFTENSGSYFTGLFDGNGHSIKNLTITETPEPSDCYDKNTNSYGLFAHISGATIKNVTLDNVNINVDAVESNGENYTRKTIVGAFCASMSNSVITYCNFSGNIKVNNCTMSGSLSSMDLGNSNISYVKNSINGDLRGGIIGSCDNGGTVVSFCENKGNIKGNGGIVAGGSLNINNCVNYGNIFGMSKIGGIVGYLAYKAASNISNCINIGEIKSESDNCKLGGIVGDCSGNNNYEVTITNCENQGKIQFISHDKNGGYISAVGGIIGNFDNIGEVSNCQNKGSIIIDYGDCIDGKSLDCGGVIGYSGIFKGEYLFNYGDIEFINAGASYASISGISGGIPYIFSDCVNYGNINVSGAKYDSSKSVFIISGVLREVASAERIGNEGDILISGNPRNVICGGVSALCYTYDGSNLKNIYNTGKLTVEDEKVEESEYIRVGGITSIFNSTGNCDLFNAYSYGSISVIRPNLTDNDSIGLVYALISKSATINATNVYVNKNNESVRYGAGDSDIVGSITSLNSFSNKNSFNGFDFDNTWELTNDRYPTLKNASNNTVKSIEDCDILLNNTTFTYDGTAKQPSVTVKNGSTTLTNGTDYSVSYSNNINAGTATATITGKGNYTGTVFKTFTIIAKSISSITVTLNTTSYTYDGTAKKPSVTVKDGSTTLTIGTDYTVSYSNNTNVGTAIVTISGKGNYTGTVSKNFTITNSKQEFTWGQDNWNFNNTSYYFTNYYNVNSTVMNLMKEDFNLSDSDIFELQKEISRDNFIGFKGSCFGMTTSEILVKQGDLKLSRYGLNDVVYKNSNTSNATSVINFIQELQSNSNFCQSIRQAPFLSGNHTQYEFVEKLESVLENESMFVKISYGTKQLNRNTGEYSSSGYHAVLGYGIEDCDYYSSVTGKTYDKRVLIADPNYSARTSLYNDACLYYRSSDHSWIVPYWNKKYSSVTKLCYWNAGSSTSTNTGNIRNIMKYNSLTDSVDLMADYQASHYVAGLEIDNFSKNTTNVDQVMNSGNPNLDYAGDSGSGIARYDVEMDDSYNVNENNEFYALWNPTANYELSYTKPSDYNLKMDYDNITYYADLTNSFYTLFKPSGEICVKGSNAEYDITMVTDDSNCVTDWYAVGITGNYMDDLVFTKVKDGYTLKSSNLNNVTINAKNNNADVSRTFSTQYNSVFIYEIDENTIGLKVDTDNNGTYETELNATMIGDVNSDGSVTVLDATMLQKYLAGLASFSDEQLAVADTNGDGQVTVLDATAIQKYLANLITSLG